MGEPLQVRLRSSATGDRDPLYDGIRRPIGTASRIRSRSTVQMKADGARTPGERVVVVVQAVPPGIQCGAIATQRRRRCSELCRLVILDPLVTSPASQFCRLMNIPVSRNGTRVGHLLHGPILKVKACFT